MAKKTEPKKKKSKKPATRRKVAVKAKAPQEKPMNKGEREKLAVAARKAARAEKKAAAAKNKAAAKEARDAATEARRVAKAAEPKKGRGRPVAKASTGFGRWLDRRSEPQCEMAELFDLTPGGLSGLRRGNYPRFITAVEIIRVSIEIGDPITVFDFLSD